MTRKYNRKKNLTYSKEELNEAVFKINSNELTLSAASAQYKIPKSTLHSHMSGRTNTFTPGRPTLLNIFEERAICDALLYLSDAGMCVDNQGLKEITARYCEQLGNNNFKNEYPSNDWIYGLNERWKHVLNKRLPQTLSPLRAKAITEDVLNHFYELLNNKLNTLQIRNKPSNIFNCDETGFLCAKG